MNPLDLLGVELARGREGRDPGLVTDVVGEPATESGDDALTTKQSVQAHGVFAEDPLELLGRDGIRFRSELGQGAERVEVVVTGHHPHPGALVRARLGQQQRRPVLEAPPGLTVPWLRRLFGVGPEPAALHQVHEKADVAEVEIEELAPRARARQGMSVGGIGIRCERLQHVERDRAETLEDSTTEVVGDPFGVGPNLSDLRHPTAPARRRDPRGARRARSAHRHRHRCGGGRSGTLGGRGRPPREWSQRFPGPG